MTLQPSSSAALSLLKTGQIEFTGEFVWGSNSTYQVNVSNQDGSVLAVYKPASGEQPLWDFPVGTLAGREVAAFETSRALGWDLVPPTVLRQGGPRGEGSIQFFVAADAQHHYFEFDHAEKQRLRPVAVFDMLVNNADRKGGHILFDEEDHLWLIDHGLTFHQNQKLRTIVWDFVGEPIPENLLKDLAGFADRLQNDPELIACYEGLITSHELAALKKRADELIANPGFPGPGPGRPYPWPLV